MPAYGMSVTRLWRKYSVTAVIRPRWLSDMAPVGVQALPALHMAGSVFRTDRRLLERLLTGAPADGSAWTSGDCTKVVMRKGSFAGNRAWVFRTDNREVLGDVIKRNRVGFRLALSLP